MLYDAIVIGGSFAGLTSALQLARARRKVLVIDAGLPRNRFASESHGVLGHDGKAPGELLREAREQLLAYPNASIFNCTATRVERKGGEFVVEAEGGARWFTGRRLLLATGVTDVLPELPGLAERWGHSAIHCPYCHGYEIGGGPVGVLGSGPMSFHQALMFADWGEVTLFTQGIVELGSEERAQLARRKVAVEPVAVAALEGEAPARSGVRLADGRFLPVKALLLSAKVRQTSPIAAELGCVYDETPFGQMLRTDELKLTTVAGVFAAGDHARMNPSIVFASADGAMAGVALHRSLIMEEAEG
jgi:thioredoxin reductase